MDLVRKRRPDDNEDDNLQPPHPKRTKTDQALQDTHAEQLTNNDNGRNHSNINNTNCERVPGNNLSESTAEEYSNIHELSQEEDYEVCQEVHLYSHINNILKEAHLYSRRQRGQSSLTN
ncbi:protein FAM104A-like [Apodemus sylvaticus]|uniref:protein FAM104A-like n=1 Tax=Apodemus sylvaticus TaxID=10129 RepID=UPI002243F0E2|nr:protein FAM104A-like [Apodemus sylvaticus]